MSPTSRGLPSFRLLLLAVLTLLLPVFALQENLVGVVDWHKSLIGAPLLEPTPPRIFDTPAGQRVISLTRKNVLACLDGANGDVVWRHLLEVEDPVVSYHVLDDSVLLLSGPSGSTARLVSLSSGKIKWERNITPPNSGHLVVPVWLGTDVNFAHDDQGDCVIVLSEGRRVSRLDLKTGDVMWSLEAPGAGDTVIFKQLYVSGPTVHVLALTSGFSKTSLTILSMSLASSRPFGDFTQIPSIVSNPEQAFLAIGSSTGSAKVLWLEHGRIRSAELSDQGALGSTKDLLPGKGHVFESIIDVGMRHEGYILGQKENKAAQIISMEQGLEIVDEFESSHHSGDKSASVYSAASSASGTTFNRVYWSFSLNQAVSQTYALSGGNGVVQTGFTFPFETASHGILKASAIAVPVGTTQMPQILLTTSSDALLLVGRDTTRWTREESLSDIAAVRFLALGEREVEETSHILADETFAERLLRHTKQLKGLPDFVLRFAQRLTSSSTSAFAVSPLESSNSHRDQFGFQQIIVAATKNGKIFGLDSSNGNTLWTRNLGLFGEQGSDLFLKDMWLVREVGDGVNPTLAVLAVRTGMQPSSTVAFHFDGFTGEVKGDTSAEIGLPDGKTLFDGEHVTAFLTPFENCGTRNKVLAVVSPRDEVHLFPPCKKVASEIAALIPPLSFPALSPSLASPALTGSALGSRDGVTFTTTPTWSSSFSDGDIVHLEAATFGPIGSYGRVLGDKSALYKYLNPHLAVVTVANPITKTGQVQVVDSISGKLVYSSLMRNVVAAKGVMAVMHDNWLVAAWLDEAGWRVSSVEIYENRNGTGQTPGRSSFANIGDLNIISQTFIAPSAIETLMMTNSKFGTTAKELVFVNEKGQVAAMTRRLLDPRRPIGKPSSGDKEEMLVPYDPMLPPDPKRVISHRYPVLGINALTSAPSLIESTSLIFGFGLDMFMTRGLNPSGTFDILSDNFNKVQLLLTLAVLSVGIAVAKPAVDRKMLNARWF